jgi:c-di-GMP-binding flagellar brake protein YcgR
VASDQEQPLIGQSVELTIVGGDPDQRILAVVVAAPVRELVVALAVRPREIPPATLQPGSEVIVTFTTTAGLRQSRTSILRVSHASQVTVALARLAAVDTIQRRQFFRISASLLVRLSVLGPPGAEPALDPRAVTIDISASGLRADTTLALAEGDRVGITVQTPRGLRGALPAEMSCEGEVVRVETVQRRNRQLLCVGIKFLFEAERERERWVQLTFTLQRSPV